MSDKFFYLSSLDTIELEDKKSWINIHRVGMWKHSRYGKVIGSIEKFNKMIENFENKVIGKDMSMDTRHDHGGALGWVEKLKIVGEKLMALVSWTPIGEDLIKNKIYRYISPEYDENYEDKESGKKYGPTLVAISATNFPFLTKLEPMALSEDLEKDEELMKLLKKEESAPTKLTISEGHLRILNTIEERNWETITYEELVPILEREGLTIPQRRVLAQVVYLPYPNEYSCRLRPPGAFQSESFRRTTRTSNGKTYSIIMGRLKGETTMTEQAYRYGKDAWEASSARSHCERHKGNFEA